jgi:hypothetical protein
LIVFEQVTCIRAALLNSAQIGSYDTIKNNVLIKYFGMENGFQLHLFASFIAGLITTTVANPGEGRFHLTHLTGRNSCLVYSGRGQDTISERP